MLLVQMSGLCGLFYFYCFVTFQFFVCLFDFLLFFLICVLNHQISPDHGELKKSYEESEAKLGEIQAMAEKINQEMQKLEEMETGENKEYDALKNS